MAATPPASPAELSCSKVGAEFFLAKSGALGMEVVTFEPGRRWEPLPLLRVRCGSPPHPNPSQSQQVSANGVCCLQRARRGERCCSKLSLSRAKLNSGEPHTVGICVFFLPSPVWAAAELKEQSVLGKRRRLPLFQASPDQTLSSRSLDNTAEKRETHSSPASHQRPASLSGTRAGPLRCGCD